MQSKVLKDAYTFLARKKLTEFELLEKLHKKGHKDDEIERWLPDLRELGYLNDDEVIDGEVRRGVLSGYGPTRIAIRLVKRMGCDFETAREKIGDRYSDAEQIAVAGRILEKKKPPREKLYQTLYSRGFGEAVLQHFLSADING